MSATRSANRLVYLDWFRGFAVLVMIESHVFNSFTRTDLRKSDAYLLSQFLGGIAAPLFLFIAGIMVGIRIESRDDRGVSPRHRLLDVLKRAGFIFLIAELILFQQWLFQWSLAAWRYLFTVDILNAMALAIAVSCVIALAPRPRRPGFAIALGALIAASSPYICALDWSGAPWLLRNYLVPGGARFPFFPEAAYVPFGIAAGMALQRAGNENVETAMRWLAFTGFGLIYGGGFFSNQPYSIYPKSDFWINSPGLIVMRTGAMMLALVCSFLWTRFGLVLGFVRQLGTTSLLVYWVHVELVYGSWLQFLKNRLTTRETLLTTIAVVMLMYTLSTAKTRFFPAREVL